MIIITEGTASTIMPDKFGKLKFAVQMALYKDSGLADWDLKFSVDQEEVDTTKPFKCSVQAKYAMEFSPKTKRRHYITHTFSFDVPQFRNDVIYQGALESFRKCQQR